MKKILISVMTLVLVLGLVGGGAFAWFSDTETSEDNVFTAGVIDLEIDCAGDTVFDAQDEPLPKIFEYLPINDIKPGDEGEVTLSLHLKADSNNADLYMGVTNLLNFGGLNPEPEQEAEVNVDDDISKFIVVGLWLDLNGNNIPDEDGPPIFAGTLAQLATAGPQLVMANAEACTTYYVGWWWLLAPNTGNKYQGDYCTFDVVFGANQVGH